MSLVDANGLPISLSFQDANPAEVTLAFDLVQACWTEELPERVIGDKAYDSDALDAELADCGVEMIAAHRQNRTPGNNTQDGRKLRRAKRRWKVERFFAWLQAWLQHFRRMVVRYERKAMNFYGFVLLAAIIMHVRYRY
jgi:transposase